MLKRTAAALVASFALLAGPAAAEENLIGKDLTGWKLKAPAKNLWKVVGDVKMSADKPKELTTSGEPGDAPILVNDLKEKQHGSDIYTEKQFGDCEVSVELMVPKGSNSGLYLMGRYEVQVLDSGGKKKPNKGDLGGIYNTQDPIADNYEAKPAGEWQTMTVVFQAPKFGADGKKTSNAKFVSVKLNGKEIHKDVEAPKPTGGQLDSKEAATGPIMFQGDHGPVAFRNLRVKELK